AAVDGGVGVVQLAGVDGADDARAGDVLGAAVIEGEPASARDADAERIVEMGRESMPAILPEHDLHPPHVLRDGGPARLHDEIETGSAIFFKTRRSALHSMCACAIGPSSSPRFPFSRTPTSPSSLARASSPRRSTTSAPPSLPMERRCSSRAACPART